MAWLRIRNLYQSTILMPLNFLGLGFPGAIRCWGWYTSSSVGVSIFAHLLWIIFTAGIL